MNVLRVVSISVAACGAALALADGCFMAPRVEAKPTIPYQRAFISWRDGKETMIVESVLNAPKGDYAWVVPLPSVPTKVAACTPGTLETVAQLAKPATVQVGDGLVSCSLALLALSAFAGIWAAVRRTNTKKTQTTRFLEVMVLVTLGVVVTVIMFPVYAGLPPQSGAKDDVVVHAKGNAGVYQYEVVSSKSAGDLQAWLNKNGYVMPSKAGPVVGNYVKKGWCFAAMKVRHDGSASTAPHPVKFVFGAKAPIYPMALTGVANDKLRLDLFVVAQGEARVDELEVWRTQPVERELKLSSKNERPASPKTISVSWEPVGHPGIVDSLWDGATLTYLRGDLRAGDMTRDYTISVGTQPAEAWSKPIYSVGDAAAQAVGCGALAASGLLFILTFWATRKPFGFQEFARVFAWSVGIPASCGIVWFLSVQKVPTTVLEHPYLRRAHAYALQDAFLGGREPGQAEPFPEWWLAKYKTLVGKKPAPGDVPGGYAIAKTGDGWTLTVFDRFANPIVYRVDKRGNPVVGQDVEAKR